MYTRSKYTGGPGGTAVDFADLVVPGPLEMKQNKRIHPKLVINRHLLMAVIIADVIFLKIDTVG